MNIKLKEKEYSCKYTSLAVTEIEYPNCDSDGNILKKVSGKFEKGYFINEETQQKHDVAFKLIKGNVKKKFSGRRKEINDTKIVDSGESEDLLVEKEFLLENEDLYNELNDSNIEIKFGAWFGNGYKAYRVYVVPSKLYKGFCMMKVGRGNKSELLGEIIREREDLTDLKSKLDSIQMTADKVSETKIEDLLDI